MESRRETKNERTLGFIQALSRRFSTICKRAASASSSHLKINTMYPHLPGLCFFFPSLYIFFTINIKKSIFSLLWQHTSASRFHFTFWEMKEEFSRGHTCSLFGKSFFSSLRSPVWFCSSAKALPQQNWAARLTTQFLSSYEGHIKNPAIDVSGTSACNRYRNHA